MAVRGYSAPVLDHYRNPRNVGSFDPQDDRVGTAMVGAPALGEVLKLQIRLQGATIEDACFRAFGCGSAIAAGSLATVWLKGRSLDQALTIHSQDFVRELQLPPVKAHCAMLAEDAIRAAVADYTQKQR
ncbi:iron-sulfur cluster assembly scaffold protein [Castellaniella sp. S9]|uniref:iron-sulfur cluster assembly scaffold protein n=1 Tax=Castellaniella sp. S9 TaxID=2993652 RepID=UPI0022B4E611|nr:iron-sulfur cluster assembly scaffold protein [Castellaniella sp. S9]